MPLADVIGVIVPGGVAAGILLLVQAYRSYRESRQSREETVLQRWQRLAKEAEAKQKRIQAELDYQDRVGDFWRQRCADLEFEMRSQGMEVPARQPFPQRPRELRGTVHNGRDSQED